MASSPDFSEFPPLTLEAWKEKALKDLKGKPLESIDWEYSPGLTAQAYAAQETAPLSTRLVKESGIVANPWRIAERFVIGDPSRANEQIVQALNEGASELLLFFEDENFIDWDTLLRSVFVDMIFMRLENSSEKLCQGLNAWAKRNLQDSSNLQGCLPNPDLPVAQLPPLVINHFFEASEDDDLVTQLSGLLQQTAKAIHQSITIGIEDAPKGMLWHLPVGTRYFPELSKFRAARQLLNRLIAVYDLKAACQISAFTASWPEDEDQHNQLLRGTTAAMAATAGGADSILIAPFSRDPEEAVFARRLSRNISHILAEECFFQHAQDPAQGSYYIETMTEQLCEAAWLDFTQNFSA